MNIAVICGTNREGALSRLLAAEVVASYRQHDVDVDLIDMVELPASVMAANAYSDPAEEVTDLVARFLKADGVVFIVPEYNGSFPGILKLFVDMLPYPDGFEARPCAFIGLAAGQFQGLRAVEHLQGVAGYRNAHMYPRRLFIGDSYKQFIDGKIADDDLNKRLNEQADGFLKFVRMIKS